MVRGIVPPYLLARERRATVPESALDGPWRALVARVRDEGRPVRPPDAGR